MNAYRILIADIYRQIGWRLYGLVALTVLVGATEGLSVALLLPLLPQFGIPGGTGASFVSSAFQKAFESLGIHPGVGPTVGAIIFVATLLAVLSLCMNWWMSALTRKYQADWQLELFKDFISAKWEFFTGRKSGELTNAIITETGRLTAAFTTVAQLMASAVIASVYLVFAFLLSARITLCLIGVAALMVLSVSRFFRTSYRIGSALGPQNSNLQVVVGEYLTNAKIIKTSVGEARAVRRVGEIVSRLERGNSIASFLPQFVRVVFEFLAFSTLVALFAFGPRFFDVGTADIIVLLALFLRLLPRVSSVQTYLHNLNNYAPAIVTVRAIAAKAVAQAEFDDPDARPLLLAGGINLSLRDVSVSYGTIGVLESVDIAIPVPGLVGIVGGSGSGKSTLVHAILGLTPIAGGAIALGSYSLSDTPVSSWRRTIGYVPQETMLFHASVLENLRLARPDATVDDIITAARMAHAHDFIMALPKGYDTFIGDQGILLSGGQRQRLGIARALVGQPSVLLMDEPTSALDQISESEILVTIDELRQRVGILIVAHRLATIRGADCIYVLDRGRVVESGDWNDLFARRRRLHALAQAQHIAS